MKVERLIRIIKCCLTCYYYTVKVNKPPCCNCWHQNKRSQRDLWRCWLEKGSEKTE